MTSDADVKLIRDTLAGNVLAFDTLWKKYKALVAGIIIQVRRSEDELEDIMQSVLIKLWRKLHTFKFQANYKTWLYRVARNEALMFVRDGKGLREELLEDIYDRGGTVTEPAEDPVKDGFNMYMRAELLRKIDIAINKLSRRRNVLLHLRYIQDAGPDEMAAILKLRVAMLKSALFRGRKEFRTKFKQDLNPGEIVSYIPDVANL
jgi:RNA polymerase sigma-70 factor, ECF subfamily